MSSYLIPLKLFEIQFVFTLVFPKHICQHKYLLFRVSEMEDNDQPRRSHRDRKLTEKRSCVCFVTKLKNSERCYTILSILSDHLHILLFTEKNKDIDKSAYNEWLDKYEEFLLSHDEVRVSCGCLKVNTFLMKTFDT